ncbi:NAD(P)/FAD-dependent oxidoreductase [Mycobacterium sp. E1747]|uniref:flavin-containing monooxygenase n=1 Tax=Mycobacterium sp. E1747 TaxID=1834128 RepID=UPI0007FFBA26|nr:NAD(P)/FAD-dependent oxidoreductase [Mycobacterium sp. E1747]OBH10413.1 cyclohexanone monooxygenase [Mycobacterium sp. E1747]
MDSIQNDKAASQYDVVIIGAGVTGLHQLYCVRQLGLSVRAYDCAGGVGGTWYWNRYPGCCFDSESHTYAYAFSEELLQEWDWKHLYSKQPDTERYLNYVADKFDLRRDIQLNTMVEEASWAEDEHKWHLRLSTGEHVEARYVIAAVGILPVTANYIPDFPGIDTFTGLALHTSRWPQEGIDFEGKRAAVIGTGSTGVQLIPHVAAEAAQLTVFQRTPTYCGPLHNQEVTPEMQQQWKATYDEIFEQCRQSPAGFLYEYDPRPTLEVPKEERIALYEKLWARPGFEKWLGNFFDITLDADANEDFAKFVRDKIRARIKDPAVAEKLVPTDHPFGTKRIPMETDYYETYNRDNVLLVDVRETPIVEITPTGIRTSDQEYEFDVIIFATGFDAFTGGLTHMNIRGENGVTFKEAFAEGPRTLLGMMTSDFPNFFTAVPRAFCNFPRCAEVVVDWITDCLKYLEANGTTKIAPSPQAEIAWGEHVDEMANELLLVKSNVPSWFNGGNIPGKKVQFLLYANTLPGFREKVQEVADKGYEGFVMERLETSSSVSVG